MAFGDKFVFYPEPADEEWEVNRRSTAAEEIELGAADGTRLVCWHVPAQNPRATVLFFHGNAGNLSHRTDILQALARIGTNVLIVGYRGYGKSGGSPSEAGFYQDADAAYAYLAEERGVAPTRLLVLGESLGGGPAIDLASRKPVAGLIVQSAFTSIADMASRAIPFFPAGWFLKTKFRNLEKMPRVEAPKLFLAARTDEVVPYEQTRRLFEAAVGPRKWVEFDGCGHNDLFWMNRAAWSEEIEAFLNRVPSEK